MRFLDVIPNWRQSHTQLALWKEYMLEKQHVLNQPPLKWNEKLFKFTLENQQFVVEASGEA